MHECYECEARFHGAPHTLSMPSHPGSTYEFCSLPCLIYTAERWERNPRYNKPSDI